MPFLRNIDQNTLTDKELLDAFNRSGSINFLSILYQRYMDLVYGVCLKYFKNAERSKDAVMDIFEELTGKLRKHEVENFKGWLFVLTRNHCLMHLRSPRNLKTSEFNPSLMQSDMSVHPDNEQFDIESNYVMLQQCMERLPAEQKQNIELFFLQKKCYKEIAVMTGYELNKVRSYIQNGKRNLKICMEKNVTAQKINTIK